MHRCLSVPEILGNITEEITVDEYACEFGDPSPWDTLANLAQTCRMLSEPALNSLWRVQSSLLPLLWTMPADLWTESDDGILRICRPIRPTDWSRFHKYASRIHHFSQLDGPDEMLDRYPGPECLQALACAKPLGVASFCPLVHGLDWPLLVEPSEESFLCMPLFMSAATTTLVLPLGGLGPVGFSFAQTILCKFPNIRCLEIKGNTNDAMRMEALSGLFSYGQGLREVHMTTGPLSRLAAEHLSGLDQLRKLSITVDHHISSTKTTGFHALVWLRLSSTTCQWMSSAVRMLESPPLESVDLYIRGSVPVLGELVNTFEAMKLHCSHSHLRNLSATSLYEPPEPPRAIDETTIQPLLAFSNLSVLELRFKNVPFRMGNQIVREMATSWPRLRVLILGSYDTGGWFLSSEITPSGLVPLLRLPSLTMLSISINASAVDVAEDIAAPEPTEVNTKLEYLNLQDSIINDAARVAAFLSKFIPNLKTITSWNFQSPRNAGISSRLAKEYEMRWEEVARLVPIFAAVREEERARGTASMTT